MADRYFEVNKINVRYGDIQVLWDIEFTVIFNGGADSFAALADCRIGKSYNVKARHTARNIRFDAGHIGFHAEKPDAYDFSKHLYTPF